MRFRDLFMKMYTSPLYGSSPSSIENHFYKGYLDQVREQVPADMQWVVQEKVHGTNTSFLCDGNDVKFAKRTSILEDDEKFYDYQELVDEYKEKVISLFNHLKQDCPDMQSVSVFGELFGGSYPHPDVQRVGRLTMIRKDYTELIKSTVECIRTLDFRMRRAQKDFQEAIKCPGVDPVFIEAQAYMLRLITATLGNRMNELIALLGEGHEKDG